MDATPWQIEGDGRFLREEESFDNIDAGGLQGGNLSGSSMQGDMMTLPQGSFTEGMIYMNTQVAYLRFSVLTLL
ncbi:hypothetical protein M5K25_015407 [Dendrobium thyrsiflorum]|uniref:Uncharacterized protein n=1 Tax=Dendrobium thyrsiflorum TaxID=117978 RepID=A0ABD0UXI8_DENTH